MCKRVAWLTAEHGFVKHPRELRKDERAWVGYKALQNAQSPEAGLRL